MAISEVIREALAGDSLLAALLNGGIYAYEQTGRNGISRATTVDAYGSDGFLKPLAVVKVGELYARTAIRDPEAGLRQMVEVYLYDDGDSGYGTILTARDQVVTVLDRRWMSGVGFVQQSGGAEDLRDPKLNNAALVRVDFEVIK